MVVNHPDNFVFDNTALHSELAYRIKPLFFPLSYSLRNKANPCNEPSERRQ